MTATAATFATESQLNIIHNLVACAEILHQSSSVRASADRKTRKAMRAKRDEYLAAARQLLVAMDPSATRYSYDKMLFESNGG